MTWARWNRAASLLAVTALAGGCSSMYSYEYKGKQYSAEEAVAVIREEADAELARLRPVDSPVPGSATIVLPDTERLRRPGVIFWTMPPPGTGGTAIELARTGNRAMADAIERARVFDSVVIVENVDPAACVTATDWTLILDVTLPNAAEWDVRSARTGQLRKVPVDYYAAVILDESVPGLHLSQLPAAVRDTALAMQDDDGRATNVVQAVVAPTPPTPPTSRSSVREVRSLERMGGAQRWTDSDVVAVAIPDADRKRLDVVGGSYGSPAADVWTGQMWAKIFAGDERTSPMFRIEATEIRRQITGGGFGWRFRYIVDGTLIVDGKQYAIHGEGTRAAFAYSEAALDEAVQLGIVDVARKVKAVLDEQAATAP